MLGREIAIAAVPGEPMHKLRSVAMERLPAPFNSPKITHLGSG